MRDEYELTLDTEDATTHALGALVSSARTGTGSDLWATPWAIVREACGRMGWPMPTLDIAAVEATKKAPRWLGPDHPFESLRDGLTAHMTQGNRNVAWCNPPWSDVGPWLARCYDLSQRHNWRFVALVPLRPSTKAWNEHVWPRACEVAIPDCRVGFELDGRLQPACPHDIALVYYDAQETRPIRWSQMRLRGGSDPAQTGIFDGGNTMKRSEIREIAAAAKDFIERAKLVDALAEQSGYGVESPFQPATLGADGQRCVRSAKALRSALAGFEGAR